MTMLSDTLLNEDDLKEKLHFKTRAKIREFLDKNKVPYLLNNDGSVVTTLSSFNIRLHGYGIKQKTQQEIDGFA